MALNSSRLTDEKAECDSTSRADGDGSPPYEDWDSLYPAGKSQDGPPVEKDASENVTSDWVTQQFARNAKIQSGLLPSKVRITLTPRNSSVTPIVREIDVLCQHPSAANQALIQLGKSLGMFKGERVPEPEENPKVEKNSEYWRAVSRVTARFAREEEAKENAQKAKDNGQ